MPVEVRELIIRATIQKSTRDTSNRKSPRDEEKVREAIVADAVDQVMELLDQQKER